MKSLHGIRAETLLFFTLIFLAISVPLFSAAPLEAETADAPTAAPTDALSDSLAARYEKEGMYSHAVLEYKRSLFLADRSGEAENPEDWHAIARCYANEGNYAAASSAFARFMESDPEYTADICDLELSLIDKNGFAGFYRIRLVSLLRMEMSDRAARKKILILNGKAAVLGSEWENVRAILELLSDESFIDDEARERGEKTIVEAEALKPLSPALTGVMSAIIPGSGQALAGYPLDGTKALAINASAVGLSVFSLSQGDLTGLLLFDVPLFARFYLGNTDNARKAAGEHDDRKKAAMKDTLLKLLFENAG